MSAEVYYFSGTGNSFVVARDLSVRIRGTLRPVASLVHQESVRTDADVVGFVFPIYDFKPPDLIVECVSRFEEMDSKYIFAVCTYGIAPLKALKVFDRSVIANGGKLSSGFAVKMPHNGLGSGFLSHAQHQRMFEEWKARLEDIAEYINSGREGPLEKSGVVSSLVLSGVIFKQMPFLARLTKQVVTKGWESLAPVSNDRCDGCGTCAKVCPVDNIKIVEGRPCWSDHSVNCFACYHWCPNNAIRFGDTNMNIRQYHHPEARVADIIDQKDIQVR